MIENYNFGSITINGENYTYDGEVRWTDEVLKWWRKESHVIDVEDVKRAVEQSPDTIIIGTGEFGLARVTKDAQMFITKENIKLIIDKTREAVKTFNIIKRESEREEGRQRKVIGLFHLTC